MVILKSKNFKLRPHKKGDEESLIKNINDKTIANNTLHIPYPYTLKDAKDWIKKCLEFKKKKRDSMKFAIEINGEVIGGIGLSHIGVHSAEIGYWLGKKYRNKGIMIKAIKLLTGYGFKKLKLKRIYAFVFSFNKASIKVLEKLSYKYEGHLKKAVIKKGKYIDCLLYAKVK